MSPYSDEGRVQYPPFPDIHSVYNCHREIINSQIITILPKIYYCTREPYFRIYQLIELAAKDLANSAQRSPQEQYVQPLLLGHNRPLDRPCEIERLLPLVDQFFQDENTSPEDKPIYPRNILKLDSPDHTSYLRDSPDHWKDGPLRGFGGGQNVQPQNHSGCFAGGGSATSIQTSTPSVVNVSSVPYHGSDSYTSPGSLSVIESTMSSPRYPRRARNRNTKGSAHGTEASSQISNRRCDECQKDFLWPRDLKAHRISHHEGGLTCDICRVHLASEFSRQRHLASKHNIGIKCSESPCNFAAATQQALSKHVESKHSARPSPDQHPEIRPTPSNTSLK